MNLPLLSVIIPTRNRADLLRGSLESLASQSLPVDQYEVVVVDDGATDPTPEVCAALATRMNLKYFHIEHSGISAAKNLGIFASQAPIILFFDDDDYASPTLLAEHLAAHERYPDESTAVLGYTTWAPGLQVTEVMHYVMNVGRLLFCYTMAHGQTLDFTYFWGGRTSCKRRFLAQHGIFRHELKSILEDIELGYRLSKHGLKVVFHRGAVQYMNRPISFEEFCRRCERQGRSAHILSRLHPVDVIQQYCGIANARDRWDQMQRAVGLGFYRVRKNEAELAAQPTPQRSKELTSELQNLYKLVFDGFKLKGLVEAQAEQGLRSPANAGAARPLSEPIVVYQMGKVGSTAIEVALNQAKLACPIIRSHMLNNLDQLEADARRSRPNPVETLREIKHGRQLRETLLGSEYIRCRVISLVRDPLARNLSGFFQNLNEFIPGADKRHADGSLTANDIITTFMESYKHDIPATWFERQLQPVFGIDVFAHDFPHQRGYAIYEGERARLLVIKVEMLETCVDHAMRTFLGLKAFALNKINVGENKSYKHIYKEVLDCIVFSEEFIERMYGSRYAQHFYTDQELDQFKRRWMRIGAACITGRST